MASIHSSSSVIEVGGSGDVAPLLRDYSPQVNRFIVSGVRDVGDRSPGTVSELRARGLTFDEALELVGRIAASDAPALVRGESGTGKELVARTIHQLSPRVEKPLIEPLMPYVVVGSTVVDAV